MMARSVVTDLVQIYRASINAVLPHQLIRNCLKYNSNNELLTIKGNEYNLNNKRVFLVGAGKAVQNMAQEVDQILGRKIEKGIISIPIDSQSPKTHDTKIKYCEGARNNLPDDNSMITAKLIKDLATTLTTDDVLLVLISGGGSALLPLPIPPITLKEKTDLIKKLANSGADIKELNTVRKRLSDIKGGKLAYYANPALTISLILSDIVGDPLDLIASGPTIKDTDDPAKAIEVIKTFDLLNQLPESVRNVLETKNETIEFPPELTRNYLIGSNKISISAAREKSEALDYFPIELSTSVTGNVTTLAKEYAKLVKAFCQYKKGRIKDLKIAIKELQIPGIAVDNLDALNAYLGNKHLCLILGGEPTVEVIGNGLGGRNQQLALEFSIAINEIKREFKDINIYFLSAGTDGIDGPTDAAGAIGYLNLIEDCKVNNIDPYKYLENNDCYNFFKDFENGKYHVVVGHTNTNVMDLHLIVIQHIY